MYIGYSAHNIFLAKSQTFWKFGLQCIHGPPHSYIISFLRLIDEWAGSNLHIIFVAVEMEVASCASSSVHFMVRGGEKLPRNWELRPNMAPGWRGPGAGRGRSRPRLLQCGTYEFDHRVPRLLSILGDSLPFSVLGNMGNIILLRDLIIVGRDSGGGNRIERRKLIVKVSRRSFA